MSAVSIKHKLKGKHYDIDGFITQLLASRKFDDLAEKLAEKAAYKIIHKDAASTPIERAIDDSEVDNRTKSTQEANQTQLNREYVKKYEKNPLNNVKLRKDFTGKINPQAVINATISLSENLQLKYKYLKKNALEKKVKINRDPLPKNDTKEDPSKYNNTTVPTDFKEHNNKTDERTSNLNATEKNQNDTIKKSIDDNKRSQNNAKDDDRKEDHNRNSELNESCHSGTADETNDSRKKPDHSQEEQSPVQDETSMRKAQNSGSADKGIVEQKAIQGNNEIRKEKPSSLDKENQTNLSSLEGKVTKEVVKTVEEPKKGAKGEINEDENVKVQFRAHEDRIEDNKETSDYNPYVGVFRTRASDDSGDDRSKEQSPEDQRSKEQFSEDQNSNEKSGEDSNSSKLKPVIRKEGDQLYTYVKAPEYQDYQEKLDKWQKNHPENPADFMK